MDSNFSYFCCLREHEAWANHHHQLIGFQIWCWNYPRYWWEQSAYLSCMAHWNSLVAVLQHTMRIHIVGRRSVVSVRSNELAVAVDVASYFRLMHSTWANPTDPMEVKNNWQLVWFYVGIDSEDSIKTSTRIIKDHQCLAASGLFCNGGLTAALTTFHLQYTQSKLLIQEVLDLLFQSNHI